MKRRSNSAFYVCDRKTWDGSIAIVVVVVCMTTPLGIVTTLKPKLVQLAKNKTRQKIERVVFFIKRILLFRGAVKTIHLMLRWLWVNSRRHLWPISAQAVGHRNAFSLSRCEFESVIVQRLTSMCVMQLVVSGSSAPFNVTSTCRSVSAWNTSEAITAAIAQSCCTAHCLDLWSDSLVCC